MCHYAKLGFTDKVVPFDDWAVVKPTTPLGQLPVLIKVNFVPRMRLRCPVLKYPSPARKCCTGVWTQPLVRRTFTMKYSVLTWFVARPGWWRDAARERRHRALHRIACSERA
eukprot:2227542-Rhodomonas_salina.5